MAAKGSEVKGFFRGTPINSTINLYFFGLFPPVYRFGPAAGVGGTYIMIRLPFKYPPTSSTAYGGYL